jgi:hypothetical protein
MARTKKTKSTKKVVTRAFNTMARDFLNALNLTPKRPVRRRAPAAPATIPEAPLGTRKAKMKVLEKIVKKMNETVKKQQNRTLRKQLNKNIDDLTLALSKL